MMKIDEFDFPDGLSYIRGHVWVKSEGKTARLGLTSLGASLAKEIVHVDLPDDGREYAVGEVLASYETIKSVSEVIAPFRCRVSKVNENLLDAPSLINADPYGKGWVLEVEVLEKGSKNDIMSVEQAAEYYGKILSAEKERYKGIYD
jgi:glycine cleavage system H protein